MSADTTDRREMLREAFQAATKDDDAPETEVVEEAPEEEPEQPETAESTEEKTEEAPEDEGKESRAGRDEKGRFAPAKEPAKAKADAPAKQETKPKAAAKDPNPPPQAEQPKAPEIKPPQSLKPAAREAWNKLAANPDARALLEDVARVEGETRRVLGENAQLRKSTAEAQQFRQQVESFVTPYAGIFRAEGLEPMQGVANLVNVYGALHYGSQQQKDTILATLIGQFGNLDGINAALQGQPQAPQQPQPQYRPPAQQQADPREIVRQELAAARQKAEADQADNELDGFMHSNNGGEPEFIRDVWQDMMLLLDAAHSQGRKLTFPQAYDRACRMNEDVQAVLNQRAAAAAVAAPPSASPAQRARAAAATSKPRSAPAVGGPGTDPGDRRAMLERAAAAARSR